MLQIALVFGTILILPSYLIVSLWKEREMSQFKWLLKLLYSGMFLLYVFVAGRWDWTSYYLRYVFPVLFVAAAIASYRETKAQPFFAENGRGRWRHNLGALVSLVVFMGFFAWAARGYFYSDTPVRLAFPLEEGWYYVGQGGNSTSVNYHNSNSAQQYALDVAELNALGVRARGIYPTTLERYVIFGRMVRSPCDGTVATVVDGLPDQIPPAADRQTPAGNHVVIACKGVNVLLAHLHAGSIVVASGDAVTSGQRLGRVGNSGNTSEPHLHIHAVRAGSGDVLKGDGVPILFDGTFAVRNTTF